MAGISSGNAPIKSAATLNEEALLLIYEPSKELFAFVMQHFDMSEILGDKRIKIFVKGINVKLIIVQLIFIFYALQVFF
mgnify:CR=1 FL=1